MYEVKEIFDYAKWDEFVKNSDDGTLFNYSLFLTHCGMDFQLIGFYKGEELKAILPITLSGNSIVENNFIIYNGPILKTIESKKAIVNSETFKINEFIAQFLVKNYNSFFLQTFIHQIDIRPYLWVNYHNKGPKINCSTRYTCLINIEELANQELLESQLFKNCETLRQRNYRKAISLQYQIEEDSDIKAFVQDYSSLMVNQNSAKDSSELLQLENLLNSLSQNNLGSLFSVSTPEGIHYKIFMGWDNKRAYYLYGAPVKKDNLAGTFAFFETMKILAKKGIKELDFEGANSPQRGHFKLSFGSELKPYFQLEFNNQGEFNEL